MKSSIILLLFIWLMAQGCGKKDSVVADHADSAATLHEGGFDIDLAQSLGADDYGMKQYVMAFLKTGPTRSQDSAESYAIQRGHLDNIIRLSREGKLVVAGPFLDNSDIRGIFLFNTTNVEEARKWTSTDPAVQSGRLLLELHPWYGSAALIKTSEIHETIAKKGI